MKTFNLRIALLSVLIALLCFATIKLAKAEEPARLTDSFITYTDSRGQTHFTDSWKQVPERYKQQAKEVAWKELQARTDKRMTESHTPRPSHRSTPTPNFAGQTEEPAKCGAPYHIERRWLQFGDYTRLYATMYDSCGNALASGLGEPQIYKEVGVGVD